MQFELQVNPDSSRYAVLNTEGVEIPNKELWERYFSFPLKSYSKLKNNKSSGEADDSSGWISVFGYVNILFNTFTPKEQAAIVMTYGMIHKIVEDASKNKEMFLTNTLINTISEKINNLDREIDLVRKTHHFVMESGSIKIGIMKDAGSRPQDSKELTFHDDEVMLVATLAMLCKMFCPVFGLLISVYSNILGPTALDMHCSSIFTALINTHNGESENVLNLKSVTEKLKYYIEHQTAQICRGDIDSGIVAGYDVHSLAYSLYCKLLVRKLVGISLAKSECNIMAFIVVFVRSCTRQTICATKSKQPSMLREDMDSESEDGNTARLETDSMTSKKTADIEALISAFVGPTVRRIMTIYDISSDEIKTCSDWYQSHPIVANSINQQLNSLQYGSDFDGSIGIKMLKCPQFSLITILTQLILIHHAENMNEAEKDIFGKLIHLVTAVPGESQNLAGVNPNNIWLHTASSPHYQKCLQRFPNTTAVGKIKAWEEHVHSMILEITPKHYMYNSAPYIWEALGQENRNGTIIPIDSSVFIAYCYYYNWELQNKEQQRRVFG